MEADLVLEGGGVRGIALAGAISTLQEAGYRFQRVAGTSAGSVVGALVAGGMASPKLEELLEEVRLSEFQDPGFLSRLGAVGKLLSVFFNKGVYRSKNLRSWVDERMRELGAPTFGDLRLPSGPGAGHGIDDYRLVVIASDLTRGTMVRFPWDYPTYGLDPDAQSVADAVRASSAIPFFFRPVKLRNAQTRRDSYLVDGGILSNFPVGVFDRRDQQEPRWPTFGIKLSARPEADAVPHHIRNTFDFGRALLGTMVGARDQMHLDDPCVVMRTIFVDTGGVSSTNFDLTHEEQQMLFENGRSAAAKFLEKWSFDDYVARCRD